MSHLRFAGRSEAEQQAALIDILRASPRLWRALRIARDLDLPQWRIVSGAIYNQVWNHLTGRPELYGVKDIDLFYFDPDLSYEAEDRAIRRAAEVFPATPPVEARNQARVHLWFEGRFGEPYPPLPSADAGIDRFAARTHCVGVRLEADEAISIYAPFGLDDIFAFRVTPNPVMNNRATHELKATRQAELWPELEIVPWPAPSGERAARS